jgi:thioredoxin reductase (NADPH)
MEQAAPFKPGFTLGERADSVEKQADGSFIVTTSKGTQHHAPVVMIAGGLGSFEPRKPLIGNIGDFEEKGVRYIVKNPDQFEGKDMVISGGGDSALDWAIYFAERGSFVHLVHRSDRYRAHKDSVSRAQELATAGKMKLHTFAEVKELNGEGDLASVVIHNKEGNTTVSTNLWFPLFGLSPKLGPIADWGLEIEKNAIVVDTFDYQTNQAGIFAIGDVNTYPGKLKLILCGFHEATLAVQTAYKIINPNKKFTLKYTTVQGVQGFDEEQPKENIIP